MGTVLATEQAQFKETPGRSQNSKHIENPNPPMANLLHTKSVIKAVARRPIDDGSASGAHLQPQTAKESPS